MLRRHRIIETFLVEKLGFSWDDVHEEAERLEHAASDNLIERMAESLGNPSTDPHGSPIPTSGGEIDTTAYTSLAEVAPGTTVIVVSVPDKEPTRLRHFEAAGLVPGAVLEVTPGDGGDDSITLAIATRDESLDVDQATARRIKVKES